jgi:hypothetical protein
VPPRDDPRKTRGQDGIAISFPVRLFHSLPHAGLSRRTTKKHNRRRPIAPLSQSIAVQATKSDKMRHFSQYRGLSLVAVRLPHRPYARIAEHSSPCAIAVPATKSDEMRHFSKIS